MYYPVAEHVAGPSSYHTAKQYYNANSHIKLKSIIETVITTLGKIPDGSFNCLKQIHKKVDNVCKLLQIIQVRDEIRFIKNEANNLVAYSQLPYIYDCNFL